MARFDLVVFDWDGTLMDSAGLIVSALRMAATDVGLDPPSEGRARHIIGLGLRDALQHAMPELAPSDYSSLAARYRHHYLLGDEGLALFPGAAAMIRDLHAAGRMLAVATGKSRHGLDRALASSGLDACFHATRCADECHSKPHPQMLLEILEEFGMSADSTLMIGDTTHDLQMAKNAGVPSVAVSYGAHPEDQLLALDPLYCAHSIQDLEAWLKTQG
jgi:phosphoglycolate phosphatase